MDFEEEVGNVVGDRPIFKPPSVVVTSTTERGDYGGTGFVLVFCAPVLKRF
jgi:hypothetical protein